MKYTLFFLFPCLLCCSVHNRMAVCFYPKIRGITLVAPPAPFRSDPTAPLIHANADWVAVVPYAFTRPGSGSVRYNVAGKQWWGELPEGIRESISLAHHQGMKVMLKPQVYVPGGWTGDLVFPHDSVRTRWEQEYAHYLLQMANMAQAFGVELLCVGTEFRSHVADNPAYWPTLIAQIRKVYGGKLTYSANWDDYEAVPFWRHLDFIGISAYFPLTDAARPNRSDLHRSWEPIAKQLARFSAKAGKPVLFTEFGYLSVPGCAGRTWELESRMEDLPVDEPAQATALAALLSHFGPKDWWAGGFLWKWFPDGEGHEGNPEKDYTPQGKAGEVVLRQQYGAIRDSLSGNCPPK